MVPELKRMDKLYRDLSPLRLRDAFFSPEIFVQLNDMDALLRGSLASPVKVPRRTDRQQRRTYAATRW